METIIETLVGVFLIPILYLIFFSRDVKSEYKDKIILNKTFQPPFKLSHGGRAIYDSKGKEVVYFNKGTKRQAKNYCEYLNNLSRNEKDSNALQKES